MKKRRTADEVARLLRDVDRDLAKGLTISDVCRKIGIAETTYYRWRQLDQDKLTPLLRLKYHGSIADAVADLGRPEEIGKVFIGFQKFLYEQQAVA